MPNYSSITILGHCGRNAELRTTSTGKIVASFSVAVKGYKDETTWFNVAVFGNTAEKYVGPYLKKGMAVMVVGEPKLNTYTAKDGQMKASIEIMARVVEICERKEQSDTAYQAPDMSAHSPAPVDDISDIIPF